MLGSNREQSRNSHECNSSPPSRFMGCPLCLVLGEYDSDDHVAKYHACGAGEQNGLSAQFIDVEDRWYGGNEHGDAHNTRS